MTTKYSVSENFQNRLLSYAATNGFRKHWVTARDLGVSRQHVGKGFSVLRSRNFIYKNENALTSRGHSRVAKLQA